jgi:hypothetical protein
VVIRHIGAFDRVPSVDVHVTDGVGRHGYLATTLRGRVERAYPFGG